MSLLIVLCLVALLVGALVIYRRRNNWQVWAVAPGDTWDIWALDSGWPLYRLALIRSLVMQEEGYRTRVVFHTDPPPA